MKTRRELRNRWALHWVAVAAFVVSACGSGGDPPGGNVLLLILDDLGLEKVGAYGEDPRPAATPNIDALAARGVRFRNAYAPTACSPSRAAMLTGRYPRRYGLGMPLDSEAERYELPLSEVTLPEILDGSPLGYDNSAVGKWHLASLASPSAERHPLLSGFRWYAGSQANLRVSSRETDREKGYYHWEKDANGRFAFVDKYATSDTVDDALARIEAMKSPWLLWVAFNAVHVPIHVPPDDLYTRPAPQTRPERFDAMIQSLDTEIGRLLQSIDPTVLAETTVILVSDNGTADRRVDPTVREPRAKGTLNERGINVPLIVAGPLVATPGSESLALVHVADVFSTVAEIAGIDVSDLEGPEGRPLEIDGISLLPYLTSPAAPSRREFVFQDQFGRNGPPPYEWERRAIRDERYKLVQFVRSGVEAFYDLEGRFDDGPNLMGSLNDEQRAAYERLRSAMVEELTRLDAGR